MRMMFAFYERYTDSPQCGFSMAVSNVLKHLKVNFKGINVLEDENLRQGIKDLVIGQQFLNFM